MSKERSLRDKILLVLSEELIDPNEIYVEIGRVLGDVIALSEKIKDGVVDQKMSNYFITSIRHILDTTLSNIDEKNKSIDDDIWPPKEDVAPPIKTGKRINDEGYNQ